MTVVEYKLTVLCFFFDIFYIMNKTIVIWNILGKTLLDDTRENNDQNKIKKISTMSVNDIDCSVHVVTDVLESWKWNRTH